MTDKNIHEDQPMTSIGADLADAKIAVLLLHGRGAAPRDILTIVDGFPMDEIAYLAPKGKDNVWYHNSGFAPLAENEPYLTSAINTIDSIIADIEQAGTPKEKIVLGGFSQGACLATQYVVTHPTRYGGLFFLSGALMGNENTPRDYDGSLDNTPVYIGGIDADPWVSKEQLQETADVMKKLGATVAIEVLEGNVHATRPNEVEKVREMITSL